MSVYLSLCPCPSLPSSLSLYTFYLLHFYTNLPNNGELNEPAQLTCSLVNQWTQHMSGVCVSEGVQVCVAVCVCLPVNLAWSSFVACKNIFAFCRQHCQFHTPIAVLPALSCVPHPHPHPRACPGSGPAGWILHSNLMLTIRGTFNWLNWSRVV